MNVRFRKQKFEKFDSLRREFRSCVKKLIISRKKTIGG